MVENADSVRTRTCGCPNATFQRVNTSTGDWLLLCLEHVYKHDQGYPFPVYDPAHIDSSEDTDEQEQRRE